MLQCCIFRQLKTHLFILSTCVRQQTFCHQIKLNLSSKHAESPTVKFRCQMALRLKNPACRRVHNHILKTVGQWCGYCSCTDQSCSNLRQTKVVVRGHRHIKNTSLTNTSLFSLMIHSTSCLNYIDFHSSVHSKGLWPQVHIPCGRSRSRGQ